ncbi:MAG: hypothetical protein KFH87_11390 [Bacteroidetes bacterium]|nr:hypothetical protein [Bacteroidota bacterium]
MIPSFLVVFCRETPMLRICILLATLFCILLSGASSVTAQKRVLFRGTVAGYDGQPMKKAHIEMWRYKWGDRYAGTVEIAVADNGSFITKLRPGLYHIQFAGVDHAYSEPRYLFIDSLIDCTVQARMQRSSFLPLEDIDSIFVSYHDAGDVPEYRIVPMQRVADSSFSVMIVYNNRQGMEYTYLGKRTPLQYSLGGIVPDRWVNGTDQDSYAYDGGGDFFSMKRADDSLLTIHFDYGALTGVRDDPSAADRPLMVSGAPFEHPYAVLRRRLDAYGQIGGGCSLPVADSGSLAWHAYRDRGIEPMPLAGDGENSDDWERIRERQADSASIYAAEVELAKQTDDRRALECALLLYLNAVSPYEIHREENTLHEPAEDVRAMVRFATEAISPDAPVWNLRPLYSRFSAVSDSLRDAYALRVMREHPSPTTAFDAYELLKRTINQDTSETRDQRLSDLMVEAAEIFRGTVVEEEFHLQGRSVADEARNRRKTDLEHRWSNVPRYLSLPVDSSVIGKPMPEFRFATLRDSTQYITDADLAGVPYILVLGGGPVADVVSLEAIHDRYAASGLRIVRVWIYHDRWGHRYPSGENVVRAYERQGFSMPWTHVQAENAEVEQLRIKLKAYNSGLVLVGPDSTVLAADRQMDSIFMEYAVERFFEGELK